MAAFLAACLSSAQVATFTCPTSGTGGAEPCGLPIIALAGTFPEVGMIDAETLAPNAPILEPRLPSPPSDR
jgi:hypothetical protein